MCACWAETGTVQSRIPEESTKQLELRAPDETRIDCGDSDAVPACLHAPGYGRSSGPGHARWCGGGTLHTTGTLAQDKNKNEHSTAADARDCVLTTICRAPMPSVPRARGKSARHLAHARLPAPRSRCSGRERCCWSNEHPWGNGRHRNAVISTQGSLGQSADCDRTRLSSKLVNAAVCIGVARRPLAERERREPVCPLNRQPI